MSADQALRQLLPEGAPVPSTFEEAGAVVHLNLRDELRPWRHLIGAVLLDKLAPRVRTVVTKRGELRGPFRTFEAEVSALGGILAAGRPLARSLGALGASLHAVSDCNPETPLSCCCSCSPESPPWKLTSPKTARARSLRSRVQAPPACLVGCLRRNG